MRRGDAQRIPAWMKIGFGTAVPFIAGAYTRAYGPENFLWISDIALASTAVACITESRLLASMQAVGALPLEIVWSADFVSGGRMTGFAGYMFDETLPRRLRAISLFHLALPPALLWMLLRLGYDRRALAAQTAVTWILLPLTYAVTEPEKNINWVFGPGGRPQRRIRPSLYLALEMVALPALVFAPMHLLLRHVFGRR